MSQYNIDKMKTELKKNLDKDRYEHTIGVMYTAAALAMRYKENVEKALVAGLLHDCAKSQSTNLLHAKVGAQIAEEQYGVSDPYITDAIRYHTTGRPNMTLLDKIIYIADYIEPNREKAPNLEIARHLAFQDLDECLLIILENTLQYLNTTKKEIDATTEAAYLFYKQEKERECIYGTIKNNGKTCI